MPHRTSDRGGFFSRNARSPSCMSASWNHDAESVDSKRRPASSGPSIPRRAASSAAATASGPFAAIVFASPTASVEKLRAAARRRLTRPIR